MVFKEKNEFRTGENGVKNFRIPVILQDREHGFENWRKNKFTPGSYQVRIPVKFAQGTESMQFLKSGAKANSHRVSGVN